MEAQVDRARRLKHAVSLVGIASALLLAYVPAAGSIGSGAQLQAFVRATSHGPLPACSPAAGDCTGANRVDHFIYVANNNRLSDTTGRAMSRATLPNAFVVHSVEQRIFIDGVEFGPPFVLTPPPDPSYRPWSGHWPSTVTCPATGACTIVGSPAVVPGEVAAVLYAGWVHGDTELNGLHVFSYTIRGTLEGDPVELHASGPPILMTD